RFVHVPDHVAGVMDQRHGFGKVCSSSQDIAVREARKLGGSFGWVEGREDGPCLGRQSRHREADESAGGVQQQSAGPRHRDMARAWGRRMFDHLANLLLMFPVGGVVDLRCELRPTRYLMDARLAALTELTSKGD